MKFTPDYPVMYRGVRHPAGERFDIDPEDAEEMAQHGIVENQKPPTAEHTEDTPDEEPPARKPGRPKKE